jgi:hypothetical protein
MSSDEPISVGRTEKGGGRSAFLAPPSVDVYIRRCGLIHASGGATVRSHFLKLVPLSPGLLAIDLRLGFGSGEPILHLFQVPLKLRIKLAPVLFHNFFSIYRGDLAAQAEPRLGSPLAGFSAVWRPC